MGVCPEIPVPGVSVVLGNDLASHAVGGALFPVVTDNPHKYEDEVGKKFPKVFTSCAVTRSMTRKCAVENKNDTLLYGLRDTIFGDLESQELTAVRSMPHIAMPTPAVELYEQRESSSISETEPVAVEMFDSKVPAVDTY